MGRLEFAPKPSKWLFFVLLVLHLLAFTALYCANFMLVLKLLVGLFLLWSGYRQCWLRVLQRSSRAIVKCVATADKWLLVDRLGREYEVKLVGESLVTTVLIILNFGAAHPALILCSDSLDADTLRRLRALLLSH